MTEDYQAKRVEKLQERLGCDLELAKMIAEDELFDGEWRCGDCLRIWPKEQDGCPCWIPTPEEMAEAAV